MTREELIQALKKAERADSSFDLAIADTFDRMPSGDGWAQSGIRTWHKNLRWTTEGNVTFDDVWQPPPFTASLDAAMTLVPECCGVVLHVLGRLSYATVTTPDGAEYSGAAVHAHAITLCIVALKAQQAMERRND